MADTVIITNQGRIGQVGTPEDVCRHPATEFVEGFIDAERFEAMMAVKENKNMVCIG